jgi:hypothetical protein
MVVFIVAEQKRVPELGVKALNVCFMTASIAGVEREGAVFDVGEASCKTRVVVR